MIFLFSGISPIRSRPLGRGSTWRFRMRWRAVWCRQRQWQQLIAGSLACERAETRRQRNRTILSGPIIRRWNMTKRRSVCNWLNGFGTNQRQWSGKKVFLGGPNPIVLPGPAIVALVDLHYPRAQSSRQGAREGSAARAWRIAGPVASGGVIHSPIPTYQTRYQRAGSPTLDRAERDLHAHTHPMDCG